MIPVYVGITKEHWLYILTFENVRVLLKDAPISNGSDALNSDPPNITITRQSVLTTFLGKANVPDLLL